MLKNMNMTLKLPRAEKKDFFSAKEAEFPYKVCNNGICGNNRQ